MPIYAYKCESCGFAKDVLQKISDLALSVCPHCAAPAAAAASAPATSAAAPASTTVKSSSSKDSA